MNMNTPQIPWNPIHPAMMPLTQKHIEIGLRHIARLRTKLTRPVTYKVTPATSISNKYRPLPYDCINDDGETVRVTSSMEIENLACQRQEQYLMGECHA